VVAVAVEEAVAEEVVFLHLTNSQILTYYLVQKDRVQLSKLLMN
jgi:hypothetical protein